MIILGIDPGTTAIGYALLRVDQNSAMRLLQADLIKNMPPVPSARLATLYHTLNALIHTWKPDAAAIERLFFAKNAKTALAVSEARGAILLTTALAGLRVFEYTPLEMKQVVTGNGRADKKQIKKMIQITLPETRTLRARDDAFDAIAVAMTCYYKERGNAKTQ